MIYQAGVHLRNRAFDAGFMPVRSLPQPTVSVGNLTLGGTGKTPFVIYLAGLLKEMGHEPAILTRGYGRRKPGKSIILQPGENLDFPASLLGDEPALIRRRLPESWLGISSDRFQAASAIARRRERVKQADRLVFVLDDGFQRRDIRRNLDIVMIDPARLPDTERLFPLGALREPAAELRRAHVVVINGTGSSGAAGTGNACADAIMESLRKYVPEADFFQCIQRIRTILPFPDWIDFKMPCPLPAPPGTAFLAAAIGNPDRFRQDMQNMGIETRGCAFFRDHAAIGKKDWEICAAAARKAKAEAVIITEKDAVKISTPPDFPLFIAVQDTELPGAARLREILGCVLNLLVTNSGLHN
jgi:tetraacyldisaccharide 4'-kinase